MEALPTLLRSRDFFMLDMHVEVKIDTTGLDVNLTPKIQDIVMLAALNVEKRSKVLVPYDTGATQSSIKVRPGVPSLEQRVGPTTDYAPALEYGTHKMAARPYMIPSLEAESPRFKNALIQLLKEPGKEQMHLF